MVKGVLPPGGEGRGGPTRQGDSAIQVVVERKHNAVGSGVETVHRLREHTVASFEGMALVDR